jgi:threonyl-tRNA synthetase
MADAVQRLFPGTKVAFGPATDNGFYYDYDKPGGPFTDEDLRLIEKKMAEIVSADLRFTRENVSPEQAREILQKTNETYKLEHLERLVAQGEEISLYKHGEWVDLCEGPHVPSTRYLKAFQLTTGRRRVLARRRDAARAAAHLRHRLRRPRRRSRSTSQLEEAKKRDHRKLGKELDLVTFHPWAPASPFFLPRGAAVYNALIEYVRELYVRFDYIEVDHAADLRSRALRHVGSPARVRREHVPRGLDRSRTSRGVRAPRGDAREGRRQARGQGGREGAARRHPLRRQAHELPGALR